MHVEEVIKYRIHSNLLYCITTTGSQFDRLVGRLKGFFTALSLKVPSSATILVKYTEILLLPISPELDIVHGHSSPKRVFL